MTDENSPQEPQGQPAPASPTPVEPVGISEAEIQQAVQNSTDWIQKGQRPEGLEHK